MKFSKPLLPAILLRRYQRFLADVELADGSELTVHCANPGAMTTCSEPGRPVLISDSGNPRRKYRFTLEMIRMGRTWVGINTANPNPAVAELVAAGKIPELAGYGELRREVPYGAGGRSRIDLLLSDPQRRRPEVYVEIKSATYRIGEYAAFPDAVSARGVKHLRDLAEVVEGGARGVMLFFIGRADCRRFRPADEVDPLYGKTLRQVVAQGVEAVAYRFRFSRRDIELVDRLPIDL